MPRYGQNIFAMGQNAYRDAWDDTQAIFDKAASRKAGRALAAGNRQGAVEAFGNLGDVDAVRALQGDQRREEADAYDRQRQEEADARQSRQFDMAAAQKRVETLTQIAQGLKGVPAGQRQAALQRALPVFQGLGMDTQQFATLTEDQLTDAQLDLFAGELEKQWQAVNLGNGGFGVFNNRTGEFTTKREPDKVTVIGNGGVAVDSEGNVIGRNPKTFAPPRAGGSGRGGGKPKSYGSDEVNW